MNEHYLSVGSIGYDVCKEIEGNAKMWPNVHFRNFLLQKLIFIEVGL